MYVMTFGPDYDGRVLLTLDERADMAALARLIVQENFHVSYIAAKSCYRVERHGTPVTMADVDALKALPGVKSIEPMRKAVCFF
jgi:hypothetical protein